MFSPREKAEEICNMLSHFFQENYYGYRCETCGLFIPFGSEPWIDFEDPDFSLGDDGRPENDEELGRWW